MSFNAKAVRAKNLDESHIDDLADMGQGKLNKTSPPRYPTDAMGQGKLGGFRGGNLGTFMGQSSSGGTIKK